MLKAAAEAAAQSASKPMVLAVTVLTSLSDSDLAEIGIQGRCTDSGSAAGLSGASGWMRWTGSLGQGSS